MTTRICRNVLLGAIACHVVLAIGIASNDAWLHTLGAWLAPLYPLLPNHAWSDRSSFGELARALFVLSVPIAPLACVHSIMASYASTMRTRYSVGLRILAPFVAALFVAIALSNVLLFRGQDAGLLHLGTSRTCLILLAWVPSWGAGLMMGLAAAIVTRMFRSNAMASALAER